MSGQPTVEVLLATYNGERFLREQIDSILAQDYAPVRILASDDGSSDGTFAILTEYAARDPDRFQILANPEPAGDPRWNFLGLLKASRAKFVCFCDQDDVWLPGKVSLSMRAMAELEREGSPLFPALVYTDLRVVDERLQTIAESQWKLHYTGPGRGGSLALLLAQNGVTGCTALMNRALVDLAVRMPPEAEMHDYWVALVAAIFGASKGVREQTVLYRQHGRNAVGAGRGPRAYGVDQWRERRRSSEAQAQALLRLYGAEMPAGKRRLIEAYLDCSRGKNALMRVGSVFWHGFYVLGIRSNLAMLRYLWYVDPKDERLS